MTRSDLITVFKSFRLLNRFIALYGIFIAKFLPRLAQKWSLILVKIRHLTIDFVVYLASDRIVSGLVPQLCIIWAWMRLTGVWMVSMDKDHAFSDQHLLQLGIRSVGSC